MWLIAIISNDITQKISKVSIRKIERHREKMANKSIDNTKYNNNFKNAQNSNETR